MSSKPELKLVSPEEELDDPSKPLVEHLIELRRRLLYSVLAFVAAFIVSYLVAEDIFQFLVHPLATIFDGSEGRRLIYTGLTEAFITYIKVALFSATCISFPIVAGQIWMFVAPGLFEREKKFFLPFLFAIPVLFLLGTGFAYYFIIPNAWKFFLSFEMPGGPSMLPIQLEARLQEYLSLIMQLLLAFGISFQLPLALILMSRAGMVNPENLRKHRKYALLIIMIVSAILTPPDVLSMLGLALPLYFLYEISIFLANRLKVKNNV